MSAPVVATPVSTRTFPRFNVIALAAILALVAGIGLVAFMVWNLGAADNSRAAETQSYAVGYPLHGGLAGASRIATVEQTGIGIGYPMHGGLAGPSRIGANAASSYGVAYPLHGGLAGPSQVSVFQGLSFPHGGLAGPSRVDADR